jgi:hypothetical protein
MGRSRVGAGWASSGKRGVLADKGHGEERGRSSGQWVSGFTTLPMHPGVEIWPSDYRREWYFPFGPPSPGPPTAGNQNPRLANCTKRLCSLTGRPRSNGTCQRDCLSDPSRPPRPQTQPRTCHWKLGVLRGMGGSRAGAGWASSKSPGRARRQGAWGRTGTVGGAAGVWVHNAAHASRRPAWPSDYRRESNAPLAPPAAAPRPRRQQDPPTGQLHETPMLI